VGTFFAGLAWLFLAGALCLFLAYWLKRTALDLLARAFGPRFALGLYATLTLPGFFLHEGAHALAAILLRVPLRGVTFIPRQSLDDLAVGASVQVEARGPLRMALIALAPLLAGAAAMGLLSGVLGAAGADPRPWVRLPEWAAGLEWGGGTFWLVVYLIWSIGSHMAPSQGDLRFVQSGGVVLLAILTLAGLLLSLLGPSAADPVGGALGRLGDGLAIGAILDAVFLAPLALLDYLLRRR
jgi:hypothetical protein